MRENEFINARKHMWHVNCELTQYYTDYLTNNNAVTSI